MNDNLEQCRIFVDDVESIEQAFINHDCNALNIDGAYYPIISVSVDSKSVVVGRPNS